MERHEDGGEERGPGGESLKTQHSTHCPVVPLWEGAQSNPGIGYDWLKAAFRETVVSWGP